MYVCIYQYKYLIERIDLTQQNDHIEVTPRTPRSRFSVLGSRFSVFGSRFSVLGLARLSTRENHRIRQLLVRLDAASKDGVTCTLHETKYEYLEVSRCFV